MTQHIEAKNATAKIYIDRETVEHAMRIHALEQSDKQQWEILTRLTGLEGAAKVIVAILAMILTALLAAYFKL